MSPTISQDRNNRGQATVEYILLVVIILALILGPLKQFSQFFNAYIDALFGNGQYIACLLETGELAGQSADPNSSCGATFNANVQAAVNTNRGGGTGGTGGGGGGEGENNQNQDGGKNGAGKNAKKPATQVSSAASVAGDAGGGRTAGDAALPAGGSHGGQNQRRGGGGRPIANASGGKDAGEDSYMKVGEQFDYKDLKPKKGFEINTKGLRNNFSLESEEAKREEKLTPKEVASNKEGNLRPKELNIDPSRGPAAKDKDINSDGFGFSMLFKWFLIACILIALVIFVGGQAMQISKGGDN